MSGCAVDGAAVHGRLIATDGGVRHLPASCTPPVMRVGAATAGTSDLVNPSERTQADRDVRRASLEDNP